MTGAVLLVSEAVTCHPCIRVRMNYCLLGCACLQAYMAPECFQQDSAITPKAVSMSCVPTL
jgi:hypothetical protein